MIKIISKNNQEEIVCNNCKSIISYEKEDLFPISKNSLGIVCPVCEKEIVVHEYKKDYYFPDMFYHFGVNEGAVCLSDDEVQRYVNIVKRKLRQERNVGEYAFTGSGDTMVFGFKMEDKDLIFVAKNYWEDSVFR